MKKSQYVLTLPMGSEYALVFPDINETDKRNYTSTCHEIGFIKSDMGVKTSRPKRCLICLCNKVFT